MQTETTHLPHFQTSAETTLLTTARGVGGAMRNLFKAPPHDSSLYEELALELVDCPQPTHRQLVNELAALESGPMPLVDSTCQPRLPKRDLLGHLGVFMQFSIHAPQLVRYAHTPFAHIDSLFDNIVEVGQDRPLGFSEQLTLALGHTRGDLPEALWRLFITSRQHARWLDSPAIGDLPDLTRDQKLDRMRRFARSVAACKPHQVYPVQDVAGDTYYAWTHALGRVTFGSLVPQQTFFSQTGSMAMQNGTRLLRGLANRFETQRLVSDHTLAAAYGNAMGRMLSGVLQTPDTAPFTKTAQRVAPALACLVYGLARAG